VDCYEYAGPRTKETILKVGPTRGHTAGDYLPCNSRGHVRFNDMIITAVAKNVFYRVVQHIQRLEPRQRVQDVQTIECSSGELATGSGTYPRLSSSLRHTLPMPQSNFRHVECKKAITSMATHFAQAWQAQAACLLDNWQVAALRSAQLHRYLPAKSHHFGLVYLLATLIDHLRPALVGRTYGNTCTATPAALVIHNPSCWLS
jgi:hypothetical protein